MRYDKQHKTAIRQRILDMATLRFRSEGIAAVGIANLMADLGLTHGGFYWHFKDKEDLVAQACQQAMQSIDQQWQQQMQLAAPGGKRLSVAQHYLSIQHRDFPDTGCVAAALAGELCRHTPATREAFTASLQQQLATLDSAARQDGSPSETALTPGTQLSLMVGAMLLARAVTDPVLSSQLLAEAEALVAHHSGSAPD
ncbi:TetR/AcrR family transcriptional regulator [Aquitalea sp. LB_tupeE]|uniref:TetR/AcrR family transcriptional regulator n=1 Tax=Aquitalea sp. LB_tupeE TaxID=2748078 RepID=UPI0015BD1146|nr:TetR family transcriptional regulator [Aquitalea sp. LB_tupeE]NWK77881.1 TetR family transcriptional regulator [Aquitalea sp. LB_tupeE]